MASEDKGMIVHGSYCCASRRTNVCEDGAARGVGADTAKVGVMQGGLGVFVESGVGTMAVVEGGASRSVLLNVDMLSLVH